MATSDDDVLRRLRLNRYRFRPLGVVIALLPAVLIALFALSRGEPPAPTPEPPPKPPMRLDFKLVVERLGELQWNASLAEVEDLLGDPTEKNVREPEFAEAEQVALLSHRHFGIPQDRFWYKWCDPRDRNRWVAVFFAGPYGGSDAEYRWYTWLKKGF